MKYSISRPIGVGVIFVLGIIITANWAASLPVTPMAAMDPIAPEANLKVAFIGDSGDGAAFSSVIDLIKQEEADLVMHQGDFSYALDPTPAWISAVNQLDETIPYLGSDGNHDSWDHYVPFFAQQVKKSGVALSHGSVNSGSYAVAYKGLHLVFHKEGGDRVFSRTVLRNNNHIWKICSWHHNRHDFQAGEKPDEVALRTYQSCVNGGAIIATGHEHSYSRTYSLANVFTAHHGAFGDPAVMQVAQGEPGKSFVFVSGLGGRSSRNYHVDAHDDDEWWATIYTSNRYCKYTCTAADFSGQEKSRDIKSYTYTWGALFIEFHVDNNPYKAHGYFKTVAGDIIDEFTIFAAGGE